MSSRPPKTVPYTFLLTKANRILSTGGNSYGREGRLAIASFMYEVAERYRIYLEVESLDETDSSIVRFKIPQHLR